jgi:hypothetical protein
MERRIVRMLEHALELLLEIHEALAEHPKYREITEARRRGVVVMNRNEITAQLTTIGERAQQTFMLLQKVSANVDRSLKGNHPESGCDGNLELTVEGGKLRIACLKNTAHEWEIEGIQPKP